MYKSDSRDNINKGQENMKLERPRERPDFENMSEEERAEFEKNKPSMPDFESMSEEEKAKFKENKPNMPDFNNMSEEEKAKFKENRPKKSN